MNDSGNTSFLKTLCKREYNERQNGGLESSGFDKSSVFIVLFFMGGKTTRHIKCSKYSSAILYRRFSKCQFYNMGK